MSSRLGVGAVDEGAQLVEASADWLGGGPRGLLTHQARDPFRPVFVPRAAGPREAIGIEEQRVANFQLQPCGGELSFEEHSQG